MKKRIINVIGIVAIISIILSFRFGNSPVLINFDNEFDMTKYEVLNLDSTYLNLLDPKNVSQEELNEVYHSWTEFHQSVIFFINENNFKWGVQDSTISIINKIYFNKGGTIDYYGFKILNKSVTEEKKEEFKDILKSFSKSVKIDLERKDNFAQCGKTKYLNK